jgi:hypothetical protein
MVDVLRVANDALLLRADPAGAAAINAVPVEKGCDGHGVASPQPLDPTHRAATEREELGWTGKRGVALKAIIDEERETPDLRRAKAAPCFSVPFWSLQNNCKRTHFPHDAFLAFSGHLLGLLHCCCTLLPIIEVFLWY